jgi:hypothetical protein
MKTVNATEVARNFSEGRQAGRTDHAGSLRQRARRQAAPPDHAGDPSWAEELAALRGLIIEERGWTG